MITDKLIKLTGYKKWYRYSFVPKFHFAVAKGIWCGEIGDLPVCIVQYVPNHFFKHKWVMYADGSANLDYICTSSDLADLIKRAQITMARWSKV